MFDTEFWGEPISIYTDADAQEDGVLTDVSDLRVKFNGKIINRIAVEASIALDARNKQPEQLAGNLEFIANNCEFDGDGEDAWGVFKPNAQLGNEKFWLVPNEVKGYSLILPSEY
ncbi:MAG TPA: hypothetical protein VF556_17640 [Pyrinomonadaceae bacterium]|jgi:hypothetical protein